jgi:protein-disulfide isomerase
MRLLLSLFALLSLAAATPPDWTTVGARKPDGSFLLGNPAARVKLVEYASLTCPHCAHFAAESAPVLKERWIRSGQVSLEFRHFVFNALDLGAVVLARCAGPAKFLDTSAFIYKTQDSWIARAQQYQQTNGRRLAMYPVAAQLRALVDGAGLTSAVAARTGLTPAAIDACFADGAEIDRITAMTGNVPPGVTSTPTFFLGGKQLPPSTWAQLEPRLRAAGAR